MLTRCRSKILGSKFARIISQKGIERSSQAKVTKNTPEAIVLKMLLNAPEVRLQFLYSKVVKTPDLRERFKKMVSHYIPDDVQAKLGSSVSIERDSPQFQGQSFQQRMYDRLENKVEITASGKLFKSQMVNLAGMLFIGAWVAMGLGYIIQRRRGDQGQWMSCGRGCEACTVCKS